MWLKDMTFLMTAILMTSLQGNESLKNLGLGRFTLRNECSIWAPKGMLAAGSEIFSHIACLSDPTTQLSLEFVHRVHGSRLLIQIVPWIHNPRSEKFIPPDPSSCFIKLVSVPSGSVFHTDFEELVCQYCFLSGHNLVGIY